MAWHRDGKLREPGASTAAVTVSGTTVTGEGQREDPGLLTVQEVLLPVTASRGRDRFTVHVSDRAGVCVLCQVTLLSAHGALQKEDAVLLKHDSYPLL